MAAWFEPLPFDGFNERFLGGHKAVVRPVPIPNTAVKHSLADGSGFIDSARVGRRQFLLKGPKQVFRPFFIYQWAVAN